LPKLPSLEGNLKG